MDQNPNELKDRLGAFIHDPRTDLVVVLLILTSVALVLVHLALPERHAAQGPIEALQLLITLVFVLELSAKYYVAADKGRYLTQYWIDIIATIPWAQSLRVLRILRLLRVFRVAMLLSRRVRFVSALFRSAVGEYLVLGIIMSLLLGIGTFALFVSESRARQQREHERLVALERAMATLERTLGIRVSPHDPAARADAEEDAASWAAELQGRLEVLDARREARAEGRSSALGAKQERWVNAETERLRAGLRALAGGPEDLSSVESSFWATLFFLVANEPMISTPQTTVGRAVVLVVMFGGLTTFALFTGIVTALMVNRLRRRLEIDDMDRFHLNDHLVICGWNRLVPLIINEIGGQQPDLPVVVLADVEEPPREVAGKVANARVFFVRGDYTKPAALEEARVRQAKRAIIVADTTIQRSDQDRDARTVLAALMIERMNPRIYTAAELLSRENEVHLRAAGIEEVIVTSEVGGHHLALAALHTGLADVMMELLTSTVGETLLKRPVPKECVGQDLMAALDRLKRDKDELIIGLEVRGQDGPKSEGYKLHVNPAPNLVLGERDNLVVIGHAVGAAARGA